MDLRNAHTEVEEVEDEAGKEGGAGGGAGGAGGAFSNGVGLGGVLGGG